MKREDLLYTRINAEGRIYEILEILFSFGFRWYREDTQEYQHADKKWLFVNTNGQITCGISSKSDDDDRKLIDFQKLRDWYYKDKYHTKVTSSVNFDRFVESNIQRKKRRY